MTEQHPPDQPPLSKGMRSMAIASWVCPVVAWASQVVIHLAVRPMIADFHLLAAAFYLLAAVGQGVLILAGLILAIRVLGSATTRTDKSARLHAVAGLLVSGGTVTLVAFAIGSSL